MASPSVRQLVNAIGFFVAVVTGLSLPVVYGLTGRQLLAEHVSHEAVLNATRVAKYVYQHGPMWPFHRVRLAELIELPNEIGASVKQRIYTAEGKLVLEEGPDLPAPLLTRSAPILVGGSAVGRMEIEASAHPVLVETGVAGLIGLLLGLLSYFGIRVFPLRVLDRTLATLQDRERELSHSNEHLDAALNNMSQGLVMFDAQQRLVVCNRRYADMYGLSPERVAPGTALQDILEHRVAAGHYVGEHARRYIEELMAIVAGGEPATTLRETGDGRVIAIRHEPMKDGGWVATHEDITERTRAAAQIAYMAHHDALTGLPNRVRFREKMEQALAQVSQGGKLAVLCLDLDHFKAVNDTLGHPVGDALLKAVGDRLRGCLRETDTVARLGGDEFAVVQTAVGHAEEVTRLAQRLIDAIGTPFDVDGHHIVIGTSVGVALAPMDGEDPDHLLRCADMALYRAKADGRGRFHFFEAEMDARMQARRALELDLRAALAQGEFEVFYQPIVRLETNEVASFEALLRWRQPERGMVPPAEFIPLAEEIGLISQIGAWVLREACSEAMTWPEDLRVAVNLSPAQFKARSLVLDVVAALGHSGLPGHRLDLEITETVLLQDTEATLAILHQLRGLGVRISMDDFGTGYSSLSYLRTFPFDKIKIDESFIRGLPDQRDSVAIVRAVTGLGVSLGVATTAEGVETEEQLTKLRAEGCTEVQGFLFSRPMPASEIPGIIAAVAAKRSAAA